MDLTQIVCYIFIEKKLLDYVAMDIKGPLDHRYNHLCGKFADLKKIKKSIKIIMDSGVPYEFRTTIVPTISGVEEIKSITQTIAGAEKYVLQQFVASHCLNQSLRILEPNSSKKMSELLEVSKDQIPNTILRGV